ncbi:unnamed protein product [Danaus chrysippus]|uniref:(African queen) hypothetical protein n=1 Tax=Danaus chrysippus TaxID=151541 RepID=A0A8J2VVR2_9NEOP|nr:unnamed protein product [Danaus chrysippus]
MPSDSTWSPPASSERRLSNSSDGSGSGSGYSKACKHIFKFSAPVRLQLTFALTFDAPTVYSITITDK